MKQNNNSLHFVTNLIFFQSPQKEIRGNAAESTTQTQQEKLAEGTIADGIHFVTDTAAYKDSNLERRRKIFMEQKMAREQQAKEYNDEQSNLLQTRLEHLKLKSKFYTQFIERNEKAKLEPKKKGRTSLGKNTSKDSDSDTESDEEESGEEEQESEKEQSDSERMEVDTEVQSESEKAGRSARGKGKSMSDEEIKKELEQILDEGKTEQRAVRRSTRIRTSTERETREAKNNATPTKGSKRKGIDESDEHASGYSLRKKTKPDYSRKVVSSDSEVSLFF